MVRLTLAGLVVLTGVGGWALWPARPPHGAPEDPAGNGREAALHRWETSQPTHWRYVMTPRRG